MEIGIRGPSKVGERDTLPAPPPGGRSPSIRTPRRPGIGVWRPSAASNRTGAERSEHETATTRKLIEAIPDARFGWKPHLNLGPRSSTSTAARCRQAPAAL